MWVLDPPRRIVFAFKAVPPKILDPVQINRFAHGEKFFTEGPEERQHAAPLSWHPGRSPIVESRDEPVERFVNQRRDRLLGLQER
jgi:hypothetical protein